MLAAVAWAGSRMQSLVLSPQTPGGHRIDQKRCSDIESVAFAQRGIGRYFAGKNRVGLYFAWVQTGLSCSIGRGSAGWYVDLRKIDFKRSFVDNSNGNVHGKRGFRKNVGNAAAAAFFAPEIATAKDKSKQVVSLCLRHCCAANNPKNERVREHSTAAVESAGNLAHGIETFDWLAVPVEHFALCRNGESAFGVGAAGK